MSFKDGALNLLTFGGHERLELSREQYGVAYNSYKETRSQLVEADYDLQRSLSDLGELTLAAFQLLKRSLRILSRSHHRGTLLTGDRSSATGWHHDASVSELRSLIEGFSAARSTAEAVGLGSTVAVGAWSLVAVAGSATTGTSIAALSGAAATNATLAWFGGGALAAGGAGMAGGTLVLGGLALAPMIALASWRTRAKAKEIDLEAKRLHRERCRMIEDIRVRCAQKAASMAAIQTLEPKYLTLHDTYETARSALFTVPAVSFFIRLVRSWFGAAFYSTNELALIDNLHYAAGDFSKHFELQNIPLLVEPR